MTETDTENFCGMGTSDTRGQGNESEVGFRGDIPLSPQEGLQSVPRMTISEAAELAAGGLRAPGWARVILETPFRMKDPSSSRAEEPKYLNEATGWAMDSAARGPMTQISSYTGSAILMMSTASAGCQNASQCSLGGFKPSSLLTMGSAVIGVVAAALMPVLGAVIDHTRHRKLLAVASGILVVLLTGMQLAMNASTLNWLYVFICDALQTFFLFVHSASVFAYLPELTLVQSALPAYTAHFYIRQYVAQLSLACFIIVAGTVWRNNQTRSPLETSVATARLAIGIAFVYGVVFFGYAWTFLFRKRPALSIVPEGSYLLTTGFTQVFRTSKKIWKDYRALRWFMFSLLWSPEAGAGVVQSIAITFLVVTIKFTNVDIAILSVIFMTSIIAGSAFSRWVCNKVTPLTSYRAGMLMLGVSVAVSTAYLDGPDKKNATFGLSSTWGFCMGWTYPSQRVLFVTLSPKGQEAEIMGCFFFIGQVLGWLPPLLFTVMNEHGVNMRWGFGVISFFCAFAVLCTLPMGSYRHATELVARESEAKFQSVLAAASQHNNYSSGVMGSGRRAGSVTKPVTTADDNGAKVERELAMGMDPEDKKDLRAPNS